VAVSTLPIPSMYADHHVTAVRKALNAVSGVQDVQASAALKEVTIKHTKDVTDKALVEVLEKAGYQVGAEELVEQEPSCFGDPAWYGCGSRCTRTEDADLAMSGDFRMY